MSRFTIFCENSLILPVTDGILDRAVSLWLAGRRQGLSPRDADLIVAATALEHHRVLVTGNDAHFAWISGLGLENWRR